MRTKVDGFFPYPVDTNLTITSPESFDEFRIGDNVLVYRDNKIVTRAVVKDFITRTSDNHKSLVLDGVNRRTVKPGDTLESFGGSRTQDVTV